ncbi:TATA-binding protein-associated factor mot1 [Neocucurbitaria cava]|uniref:TATA-binding protein-associated factor mot1 n=1 Tax=Neocucurbitaria cava TaxID=798079 RepID=A0A9W8XY98_9PLEO|nr:TATA-binding protein-associated factor mot1 [Neocucurbitaria cava]
MSATRLDRLVTLLETGSTALIRNTAADQLADVQKQHPDELFNLLTRVIPYLRSKSWETRVAAAKAVGGIAANAEKFDPNVEDEPVKVEQVKSESNGDVKHEDSNGDGVKKEENGDNALPPLADGLDLATLDLASVLKFGKTLAASGSKAHDYKLAAMDPTERLEYQKNTLLKRLGFEGEYIEDQSPPIQDVVPQTPNMKAPAIQRIDTNVSRSDSMNTAASPPTATPNGEQGGLSKRQMNALKRKQKKNAQGGANKVQIVDFGSSRKDSQSELVETPATAHPVALKLEKSENGEEVDGVNDYFSLERTGGDDDAKFVKEFKGAPIPEKSTFQTEAEEFGLEWPFQRVSEYLAVELFDYTWEVRHGAAMGIREILRVHGAGAGRRKGKSRAENDKLNQRWLNDLACRITCVFVLDRFADFTSDNAVAPIRETAGQALGSCLQYMSRENVLATFQVLQRLIMQRDIPVISNHQNAPWALCQGGMIGLRYLVAVRNDLLLEDGTLMDGVLAAVIKGLGDYDDDVRAISAATLIPVAKEFVEMRPKALEGLMNQVWSCLSSLQDDLSASTGFIMDLLAKLCGFPQVLEAMQANARQDPTQSFHELVPRLFPFLRHTITSVRGAVLRALITFLDIQSEGSDGWIDSKALQLIFQNILLERNEGVLKLSLQLWKAVIASLGSQLSMHLAPILDAIIPLTLTPIGVSRHPIAMDMSLLIRPSGQVMGPPPSAQPSRRSTPPPGGEPALKKRKKSRYGKEDMMTPTPSSTSHNVDGHMISGDLELIGADVMIRSRTSAAQALGKAMAAWPAETRSEAFASKLLAPLSSPNSTTQLTAAVIIEEFGKDLKEKDALAESFVHALLPIVEGDRPMAYEDLVPKLQIVRTQCTALLSIFRDAHVQNLPNLAVVVQGDPSASQYAFGVADAEKLISAQYEKLKKAMTPSARMVAAANLETTRKEVETSLQEAKEIKEERDVRIRAAAAGALIWLKSPPKKPSPPIKAMMDSVKKEENVELQKRSAAAVAGYIVHLVNANRSAVVNKVVGNLVKFYCMETAETPEFAGQAHIETGILTLKKDEDVRDHPDAARFAEESRAARITKRGAREGLEQVVGSFGAEVFEKVPILKDLIERPIKQAFTEDTLPAGISEDGVFGQEVVDALSTLRALVGRLHPDVRGFVKDLLPLIAKALQSRLYVLRYAAAKCFATICSVMSVEGVTMLVESVLPTISDGANVHGRQGAIECIYHLIHVMEDAILPYVIFLITPVLGRMSDSDNDVRLLATTSFATLVKLVPLESGIPDPPGLPDSLLKGRDRERKFVAQMLDAKKVEPFEIPVGIKATLRSYQQDGVNWLAFLNRYNLHGILCDDMGLGKTLQTLCMVASDHHMRAEEFEKSGDPNFRRLPSLIVCPPTLSGHWQQEIRQYAPFLSCVAYVGSPTVRGQYRGELDNVDIVITSYDICRNDADVLKPINWNYCVLDEGHLIKNSKSKTSQAVKQFQSNHRLILSGTPIQNNVLELWSLFDFLMPGFLGSEKVFQERFAKPIAASRFAKSSSKEQEKGALAIEALHKQVLPFLLRRLKEEVLDDLPPKILQNYYCDLSELQRNLFDDFTKRQGKEIQSKAANEDRDSKSHIFQALQYMKKLCNSPALVVKGPTNKAYEPTQQYLKKNNTTIDDIAHAPKLGALKDLLVDCGIGAADVANDKSATANGDLPTAVSQHRALVFCQMKEMLDMVQHNVLEKLLPSVQFMRLDGNVEATKRQEIVNKFNSDPSYDVLLLTTSVGGLGLNLTGADTVIFVEHDWNPQKDIQAMDRAHRIGQKKVVNVYRIVTRGTLEEKILNLQRFKIDVASTVVNQQNAGLSSMQTDQILDLFNVSADSNDPAALPPPPSNAKEDAAGAGIDENDAVDATGALREKGKKGFLDDLGELWDERQYEEEFDLDGFLGKMKA